jgi:predicted RNA-binding Zn-ribbon protein involved in translation (DUF1610 family)
MNLDIVGANNYEQFKNMAKEIVMDKKNDKFKMFCNECNWEEETKGLPYEFCPKCGHVNIGFSPIRKK